MWLQIWVCWERSPEGLIAGGMGLSLRPQSLVKVAQLLLNWGVHQGRRLISEAYLDLATTCQITKADEDGAYGGNGYGFQFHIGKDGCYRLCGSFGQFCLVCPQRDLAIIAFSQNSDSKALLELCGPNGVRSICFSPHGDTMGQTPFVKDLQEHWQSYVCRTVFTDALRLTVWFIETPYVATYTLRFDANTVTFGFDVNVSFTLRSFSRKGLKF